MFKIKKLIVLLYFTKELLAYSLKDSDNMAKLWQDFKLKNNKLYSSLEEENMR